MKKIISLLASLSLAATMFTSVFAAEIANNAPVTDTVVTELTAEEFENDWVGEALPEGQQAYLVEVTATGLDLSSVRAGSTAAAKKKRTGVLLMMAEYELKFDSTDNVAAVYGVDGMATFTTEEKKAYGIALYSDAPSAYPQTTDTATAAVTAEDAFVTAFVVTTTGPVTGDVVASYKVSSFEASSQTGTQNFTDALGNVAYTVDGVEGNKVELGGIIPPVILDPIVEIGDIIEANGELENGKAIIGRAWDVTIENYASKYTFVPTFTDVDTEEKHTAAAIGFTGAEADGSTVNFVTLLRLSAERNVTLDIQWN